MAERELCAGRALAGRTAAWPPAAALRSAVERLHGWQRLAMAVGAGAASALAMAPFHLAPVLLVTLPVLAWLIAAPPASPAEPTLGRRLRSAAAIGWLFGFGYHFAGLYWIGSAFLVEAEKFAVLLPFAVTAMPAGLALFTAAATALAALAPDRCLPRILALALALSAAEWLRGHVLTGFPWNVVGYALTGPLVLMQAAGLLGIYGLTLVAALVALAPLVVLADPRANDRTRLAALMVPPIALAALAGYGALRLAAPRPPDVPGHRLRIVQPSIAQTDKWRPEKQREIFERHLAMSLHGPDGGAKGLDGITHLVWPEAAMPFRPLESAEALAAIAHLLPDGVHLVAGALRVEAPTAANGFRRRAYNSTIVLDGDARLVALYDKIHLVPFGEYLPFQETLEAVGLEQLSRMKGGFATGRAPRRAMEIPGLPPTAMLICYEAIFPGAVVQDGVRPAAMFNLTNDGWFGRSTGPYQHLHQARVRAVEEGLALIRVANNGVSAVIDPYGRLLATIALDVAGTRDVALPGAATPPPYARLGDLPFVVLMLIGAIWLLVASAGRRGR
ncbi:MAG: apolipoprotein N-acyltransferase [Hyphomicrobiaceae bacterium]